MFGATPAWFTVAGAGFLAAAVSFLFQFLKPLLEAIPLLKPGNTAHDTTLRALVFLLNLGGIVALAATAGAFDVRQWLQYAALAGAQTVGGHLLYAVSTSGKMDAPLLGDPSPSAADAAAALPASVAAPADPAAAASA